MQQRLIATTLFLAASAGVGGCASGGAHRAQAAPAVATPAASPTPAAAAGASAFAYAPGTHRYRVTTVVHRSQIQGGGRAPFQFDVTTTQLITIALARLAPDTLGVTITIDSVGVSSALDAPPPDVTGIQGAKLTGTMSPQGRIYRFTPEPSQTTGPNAPMIAALYGAFRHFFIPFSGKALTAGARWEDSTADTVRRPGTTITARTASLFTVGADTTIAGQRAVRIDGRGLVSQHGTGTEGTERTHLTSSGTIVATHYVSPDGVFLGSRSTQRLSMVWQAKGSVDSAPIVQTFKSTVELLP